MTPRFRFVFFDVDSTLVTLEGIDELAGGNPAVAELTRAAMNGEIPIESVYGRRLDLIRPPRRAIDDLARRYLASMVPGARETISALRDAGVQIQIVSAGIAQAIEPLAAELAIPPRAIHAVRLEFGAGGTYAGFDARTPLTRTGGKELVIRDLRARSKGKAALVGDGASDLEAKPAVDLFIGFGGVQRRELVERGADVFIADRDLRAILPVLFE